MRPVRADIFACILTLLLASAIGLVADSSVRLKGYTQIDAIDYTLELVPLGAATFPEGPHPHVVGLSAAVDRILPMLEEGQTVMLLLNDGVYRESIKLDLSGAAAEQRPKLIIRSAVPYQSTISGSNIWPVERWTYEKEKGLYSAPWSDSVAPNKKPVGKLNWPSRLSEMLFLDGTRLMQTIWPAGMKQGTFHLHANGLIYVAEPKGIRLLDWGRNGTMEVAYSGRRTLLEVKGVDVVLQGIRFQHAPSRVAHDESAVQLSDMDRVLIEHCRFEWNNNIGLRVERVQDVRMRNSHCSHNGITGFVFEDIGMAGLQAVKVALNFWRGIESGSEVAYYPEYAAAVFENVRDVKINGFELSENRAHGMFVRGAGGRWQLENLFVAANQNTGAYFYHMPDLSLSRSKFVYNLGSGIDVIGNVYMDQCLLYQNGLYHETRPRSAQLVFSESVSNIYIKNSVMVSDHERVPLVYMRSGEGAFPDIAGNGNIYDHPSEQKAFELCKVSIGFDAWREVTGADHRSLFADPRFMSLDDETLQDDYAFIYADSSPVYTKEDWEVYEPSYSLEEARDHYLKNDE